MRRSCSGLAVLVLVLLGCGSTGVPAGEGREPPLPGGPVSGGPVTCGPATLSFTVGLLPPAESELWPAPIVARGLVYLHRRATAFSNAPSDLEVFAFQPTTELEAQLTANDLDDELVDARDGALLLVRGGRAEGATRQLVYRDEQREVVLDPSLTPPGWGLFFDGYGAPRRLVGRDRAAWLGNDTVYFFDGWSVRSVSAGLRGNSLPYLDGNLVVWTAQGPRGRDVYLASPDGTTRLSEDAAEDFAPVTSASRIFWLSGGGVVLRELRGRETRVLAEGPCAPPATHAGMAVFACAPGGQSTVPGGQRLWLFDGTSVREIPTRGGFVFAPRLYGRRLAWLEYESDQVLCQARGKGSVVFWSGEDSSGPQAVAEVGTPCLCCDAYWPSPALSFEGDLMAWNYALGGEGETRLWPVRAAYALVEEHRTCRASP